MFDHKKNDQVIRATKHNLHRPNQPDLVSMSRIKDAVSLEPPSRLINQEFHDESTDDRVVYLPRMVYQKGQKAPKWSTTRCTPILIYTSTPKYRRPPAI